MAYQKPSKGKKGQPAPTKGKPRSEGGYSRPGPPPVDGREIHARATVEIPDESRREFDVFYASESRAAAGRVADRAAKKSGRDRWSWR